RRRPAGGGAPDDALLAGQATPAVLGLGLGHVDDAIDPAGIEHLGQILLRPAADAGDGRAFHGLQADDLHVGVLLLQVAGNAHDGAGGTHGADEMGHAAAGLPPDLRAGGLVVGLGVVTIGELVEHLALALGLHGQRQVAGAFHTLLLADQD